MIPQVLNINQVFYYTGYITPKGVMSCGALFHIVPGHCGQHSFFQRNVPEVAATLYPIKLAVDLNLRPPAPEKNALPLDQLAGSFI